LASVFQELKQRRIVQIVVSYAVSGWVALEVVAALVERGMLPEILYRVGFVLFLGGLASSVVVGWFHGEKGEQRAPPAEVALLALIAIATGFSGFDTLRQARAEARAADAIEAAGLNLNRVGVLYFRDLSRSSDLTYLADGLTETLIDRLTDVSALEVIPRSGSAQFRDSELSLDSIASILSAGILVDGTVEQRGADVRVSLVVIDGASGTELERRTLDQPADDAFGLQDELADGVSELLRQTLGAEIALRRSRLATESVGAWTDFQRGRRAWLDAETFLRQDDVDGFVMEWEFADSLFQSAEELDPAWAEPTVFRASLKRRWGDLTANPSEAYVHMEDALELVTRALQKDPRSATAYYERGTVQYLVWALGMAPTPAEGDAAFDAAQENLEQAVQLDAGLGGAWSLLSELYSQIPDPVEANLAARRALEADEFLRSAEDVILRLYATSYDLEQFRESIQYCDQGGERFPGNPTFTECRLWLMGAPRGLTPDAAQAWEIVEEHLALLPEAERERAGIQDQLLVAMILARDERPDSARAVLSRIQITPAVDPELDLYTVEALVHLALGDQETAVQRLRTYLTASPEHRSGWRWSAHWWWRDLQENEDFQRVIGG
jgi:TolB-like protein